MNNVTGQIVTVLTAIIGVALLAVLVSSRSKTSDVIKSAGGVFVDSINAATSPISGRQM